MNAPDGHHDDPLARFQLWWSEARKVAVEPDAMVLSTVASDGQPSSRVVYLRAFDANGFVLYTNLQSRKGTEIAGNPRVSLNFHWAAHERQVRVEGRAERVDDATADAYWATRPRESQIGAHASQQSRPIPPGATLAEIVAETTQRFAGRDVPRPAHWSGLRVVPHAIELWQQGAFRLHHRDRYERHGDAWARTVLFP